MEMLIVVAIIAVLVAVAIPTFSSHLHELGKPGLNSFYLSGQEITLKAGSIWIAECPNGYNILYYCNEKHNGCQLVL